MPQIHHIIKKAHTFASTVKNILIITYYWPPYAGSGVQRWLKFSKYLPEFGFKPHIYTPENPHFNVKDVKLMQDIHDKVTVIKRPIWEPYSLADFITGKKSSNHGIVTDKKSGFKPRLLSKIRANYFIPDPRKFWVKPSIKFLKNYIKEHDIDFMISTGPPHSMHLIARGLKSQYPHLKWIADIRDPWSKFDFLKNFGSSEKSLNKQAALEKSVLDQCDRVLATSMQMKHLLVDFDHDKFECITNGYDAEDFASYTDKQSDKQIRIYHAGLLNKVRNPRSLWKGLDRLCQQDPDINARLIIHLVGVVDSDVVDEIKAYKGLENKLLIEGYKAHEEVVQDYSGSDVLLLLVNNTDNAAANIPGKLFEYIASERSILAYTAPETDAAKLLESHPGAEVYDYEQKEIENLEALKAFLLKSKNPSMVSGAFKEQYERKKLTSKLVSLLNQI